MANTGTNSSISWDFVNCDGNWKRYNVEKYLPGDNDDTNLDDYLEDEEKEEDKN